MGAQNVDTLKECYLCIASWTSRTYNEETVAHMPADIVRQILEALLRASNLKRTQAMSSKLWDDGTNTA